MTEILQDNTGGQSCMRLCVLYIVGTVITIWGAASIVAIYNAIGANAPVVLPNVPQEAVWLVAAALGGKTAQRFFEKMDKAEPVVPPAVPPVAPPPA